ncbi:nucleoside/nucleotide kinase family protein [Loigolactobacillus zhaoyuanensis]|uniref:Guanylate kinase n=1 Tax=Loigolactobacillus zhaoyuanensis TaxID=2486017 RepID=A0ABW8UDV7_9LACO|nr:guanylate kinase [Loigolactobacillus zhaoyuanensis]
MLPQRLFVITGATGTGKTTVSQYLTEYYQIPRVITHTTRPPRSNEQNGGAYYFETQNSFFTKHYIEYVKYADYYYGSSREAITAAWTKCPYASIVLDTKGAVTYVETLGTQVIPLFLTVKQPAALIARLTKRGDQQEMITQRVASAEYKRDLAIPPQLLGQAQVIVNDDWSAAKRQLDQIMQDYGIEKNAD